jgi:hypothetical protein
MDPKATPTSAAEGSAQASETVDRSYLNLVLPNRGDDNEKMKKPLVFPKDEGKEDKRQNIFDKFRSANVTVTSPITGETVDVDLLIPTTVLESKYSPGRKLVTLHVRFHGGGFVSRSLTVRYISSLTLALSVYGSALIQRLVPILHP